MTDTSAISEPRTAKIGPGRLVLVVGPSGAGKDTLIDLARAACAGDETVVFVRRVVTRESSGFEDNEQVTSEAFAFARARGDFAVSWEAHGLSYALPAGIDDSIRAGRSVVANISRTVIATLRAAFADVVVVSVTAPQEVLAARLAARGRGSDGPVGERLRRHVEGAEPDVIIQNVGRAEDHANELVRVIRGR
ncbi:MAG: phosphonate metabolism protein/1,5-bisphosphokinase (PRPP-forming) PhnN [Tardiphaga sp.]|jgi:ribose 1,5-bisphosphokinase|uniref:phosphonate metabolism protein/1,5-bisphosphokinase (PRPP-forming) PhnN n=1 Tax=Tardiphaga sp. TaxID=1926292 RepID=UPI002614021B|nr:phosphonate metabolism protein/1,5-bisphosphokinase (PRPP-forming) PhnN [Tardiphaga sp.]MDB5502670.1 phosphonate metabolism protein/1,5-bisphosphokinase (PRPP-forming) PhnN [Tardiphaga sp.]